MLSRPREEHGRQRTSPSASHSVHLSLLPPRSPTFVFARFSSSSCNFHFDLTLVTRCIVHALYTPSAASPPSCAPSPPPPHSTMRSAALLPLLLAAASLAPASAHPDGFEYHAHQAFARNGTAVRKRATTAASCPSTSNLIGSYVPTWTTGAVQAVDWTKTDLAFYFCQLTFLFFSPVSSLEALLTACLPLQAPSLVRPVSNSLAG